MKEKNILRSLKDNSHRASQPAPASTLTSWGFHKSVFCNLEPAAAPYFFQGLMGPGWEKALYTLITNVV